MAFNDIEDNAILAHLVSQGRVAVPSAILPVAKVAIIEAQHKNWTGILDYPAGYQRTVEETIDKFQLHEFVLQH